MLEFREGVERNKFGQIWHIWPLPGFKMCPLSWYLRFFRKLLGGVHLQWGINPSWTLRQSICHKYAGVFSQIRCKTGDMGRKYCYFPSIKLNSIGNGQGILVRRLTTKKKYLPHKFWFDAVFHLAETQNVKNDLVRYSLHRDKSRCA